MANLTFNKNFGKFLKGETYEVFGVTADYFVNNNIADEVVEAVKDCGCNKEAVEVETTDTEEKVEKPKKEKTTNK